MGYFSNGTEGDMYEAEYCSHCVHQKSGCVVWFLHLMNNYDECNKKDSYLHKLIPKDGKCNMFYNHETGYKHPKETGDIDQLRIK